MSAETLKRLAAKTMLPNGEGFGGTQSLLPCDVAHALAGLSKGQTALLRAMYSGDNGQQNMTAAYTWAMAIARAMPGSTKLCRVLACRVVDEMVNAQSKHCRRCKGTGQIRPNQHNPDGTCPKCNGSGKRVTTEDETASELGLTQNQWKTLKPMFNRIASEIQIQHDEAVRHFNKRLKND